VAVVERTPPPPVGPVTARLYNGLPNLYRDADERQSELPSSNYPLLRYLSLIGDQLTVVTDLVERFTYTPLDARLDGLPWRRYGDGTYGEGTYGDADTADLVDPLTCDAGWLPWLAQLVGVRLDGLTVDQQRAAVNRPEATWARGTPGVIADQARAGLTGDAYVDVRPVYDGDPFAIAIVTRAAETPPGYDATLADLPARPAGYRLVNVYIENLDP
jgi:hypothetical protein